MIHEDWRALWLMFPVLVMAVGCPPKPVPIGPAGTAAVAGAGGVSPVSEADLVCSHLLDIGCPEGKDDACRRTLGHLQKDPIVTIDLACILSAQDRASARLCTGLACREAPP